VSPADLEPLFAAVRAAEAEAWKLDECASAAIAAARKAVGESEDAWVRVQDAAQRGVSRPSGSAVSPDDVLVVDVTTAFGEGWTWTGIRREVAELLMADTRKRLPDARFDVRLVSEPERRSER
jgi:hypothetical protein